MVVYKNYEWDETKAERNAHDHGITFEEAVEVFDDPYAYMEYDEINSTPYEGRYRVTGSVASGLVVLVAYTPRGERTRIISARKAECKERKVYYDSI